MTEAGIFDARQQLGEIAVAIRNQKTSHAASLAEDMLARGFEHPLIFTARGLWFAEQNRNQEAVESLGYSDSLAPENAAVKGAIGVCLTRLGRFDEAIAAFDSAIALQPDSAAFHCRKGFAHELGQDLASARKAHLRALELAPENPEILGRLAFLSARRGSWTEAENYANRALAHDPAHTAAQLVKATAEIQQNAFDAAEPRLTKLLSDTAVTGYDRFLAFGHLGDMRDSQGRIAEAFAAYSAANKECQALHATRFWANGASLSEAVAALTAHFEAEPRSPERETEGRGIRGRANHAFLLGFPRSGTTLTEQMLASHPDVVTLEEKDCLADSVEAFLPYPRNLAALAEASEDVLNDYRDRYWKRVRKYGIDVTGKLFVDMGPMHTVKLPLIKRLFPDARILFCVRDPRDVVLSCFRRRFGINPTTFEFLTLEGAASFYSAVMHLADVYRTTLPVERYNICYERLVDSPEPVLRALCDFLGLPWDTGMLNFAARSRLDAITTVSAQQIARGLNRDGIEQWRRYADRLSPVLPILEPWVQRYGYAA